MRKKAGQVVNARRRIARDSISRRSLPSVSLERRPVPTPGKSAQTARNWRWPSPAGYWRRWTASFLRENAIAIRVHAQAGLSDRFTTSGILPAGSRSVVAGPVKTRREDLAHRRAWRSEVAAAERRARSTGWMGRPVLRTSLHRPSSMGSRPKSSHSVPPPRTMSANKMAQRCFLTTAQSLRYGFASRYRECQVWSCLASIGPRSMSTWTWNLPVKSLGTRHEYRQAPPQPYWKSPWVTTWPASLRIRNLGAATGVPFFLTTGRYCSPA